MNEPTFYTIPEVINLTRSSKSFLYGQIRSGNLRRTKMGRKCLISKSDLDAFLSKIAQDDKSGQPAQDTAGKAA